MLYALLGLVGLALVGGILFLATATGRWVAVRALGVRGVRFPFGANSLWCFTTRSLAPQAVGFLGAVVAVYAVAGALMAGGLWRSGVPDVDESRMEVVVDPRGPAALAGVVDGDRIEAVDGRPVSSWSELRVEVARHAGSAVDLSIVRAGQTTHVTATPDARGLLHVSRPERHRSATFGECASAAVAGPAGILVATVGGVAAILAGSTRAEVAGPVGIVRATQSERRPGAGLSFAGVLAAYEMPFFVLAAIFTGPGRRRRREARGKAGTPG